MRVKWDEYLINGVAIVIEVDTSLRLVGLHAKNTIKTYKKYLLSCQCEVVKIKPSQTLSGSTNLSAQDIKTSGQSLCHA
jgi:hypothetical protein